MSDTDTPEEFADRSDDEKELMNRQFRGQGYGGTYCAPPAPGHDTKGFWHYFPAHQRSGYAAHAVALHTMLIDEMKIPTSLVPHRLNALDIDSFPEDRSERLVKWMADAVGLPEAMIISLPPDLGMWDMSRALVNYVAFEATRVSDHAVRIVNDDRLAALWCVSDFTARSYTNAGAKADKVFTVRPPICDGPWKNMFTPLDGLRARSGPFIFGTLGTWHERKGFGDLVRAYFKSFKRGDDVELHIRTSTFDASLTIKKFEAKVIEEIAKIAAEFGDDDYPDAKRQPKIRLLTGTALTDRQVIAWLGSLDCYVNPSYGEGLGIPHMWALAQGVPLISSSFGAVGEFIAETGICSELMFASKLVPVPASMRGHAAIFGEKSEWGGYEVDALASKMAAAVDWCRGLDRQRRGSRNTVAASIVRDHFSYEECRPSLAAALPTICRPEVLAGWTL